MKMKASKKLMGQGAALILAGLMYSTAQADTTLTIQMNEGQMAGTQPAGTRLGRGQITTTDAHSGFVVRSETQGTGTGGDSYVMKGTADPRNAVRVKIGSGDWKREQDASGQQEMVLRTTEGTASFDITLDGDQFLAGDTYSLTLQGAAFE